MKTIVWALIIRILLKPDADERIADVDSIWQSDRIIGADVGLECMSVMAALNT